MSFLKSSFIIKSKSGRNLIPVKITGAAEPEVIVWLNAALRFAAGGLSDKRIDLKGKTAIARLNKTIELPVRFTGFVPPNLQEQERSNLSFWQMNGKGF